MRMLPTCLLILPALASPAIASLDDVQARLAGFKHLRADDVAARSSPFRSLASDYIRAYRPLVQQGRPFSIADAEAWTGQDGTRAAFIERLRQDMRHWHPIFSLTFLETVLRQPPWGLYALTLELTGADAEDAVARRVERLTDEGIERGLQQALAAEEARDRVLDEAMRLDEVYSEILDGSTLPTLIQSLHVDPISHRLDVLQRVREILVLISGQGRYHRLDARVREGPGSGTLPAAIREVSGKILVRRDLDANLKDQRFGQLLGLLVQLQNGGARDQLLQLIDRFEAFRAPLDPWVPLFEQTLNRETAAFVIRSLTTDAAAELGLDVVDQLTRWVVEKVSLRSGGLRHERLVDALLLLERQRPDLLERYIERFYRDFHGFNPAGYESVILHLVGIVLRYAEHGVFVAPDPAVPDAGAPAEGDGDGEIPPHEKIMNLLRWYDASLGAVASTLPRIDLEFVEREQRAVLATILDYTELSIARSDPTAGQVDPRFIETLLQLVKRLAPVADPDEIEERILAPFARARDLDGIPSLDWRRAKITSTMDSYLIELSRIVESVR